MSPQNLLDEAESYLITSLNIDPAIEADRCIANALRSIATSQLVIAQNSMPESYGPSQIPNFKPMSEI